MILLHATASHKPTKRHTGLTGFLRWILGMDARHRQQCALARLDERLLRDAGLDRADVPQQSRELYSAASW